MTNKEILKVYENIEKELLMLQNEIQFILKIEKKRYSSKPHHEKQIEKIKALLIILDL